MDLALGMSSFRRGPGHVGSITGEWRHIPGEVASVEMLAEANSDVRSTISLLGRNSSCRSLSLNRTRHCIPIASNTPKLNKKPPTGVRRIRCPLASPWIENEVIPATNITRPAQVIMMENGRNSHSQMEDLAETVGALLSFMFQYLCRKIKKNLSFFIFLSWKRLLSRFTSQATKILLKTELKSLFATV